MQEEKTIKEPQLIESVIAAAKENPNRPRVLIRCIAYNQEPYIRATLDGFVKQETDFPFVAVVHDDASTDATADIVREYAKKYPNIIVPVCDPVNRHTEHTLGYILDEIIAAYNPDYVAICEGDDYWTDPKKLQKQVDYLDDHPEYVLCHGNYELVEGKKRKSSAPGEDEPYFAADHTEVYHISAFTTLYRYSAYKKIPNHRNNHHWLMGDYPLWIELSQEGKFHYFPEVFGKYRVLPNTYSHSTDGEKIKRFWNCRNEITKFYCDLYGYEYKEKSPKSLYLEIQKQCFQNHDIKQAKRYWAEGKKLKMNTRKGFAFYFCNVYHLPWLIDLLYRLIG